MKIKPPTTYDEQLLKLKKRGCLILNEDFCKAKLTAVSYYRLTAYFLPFKTNTGSYQAGTSFERVYRIYEFDRKLRATLLSAVEEVEIFLRAQLSYFHAHKYGSLGYLDPKNFSKKHNDSKFKETLCREIDNNKQALFVKHHVERYDGKFPVWVISELFTFGMLSYFFNDLKTADQKRLSAEIYGTTPKNVASWLRCCTDLRNICAHYGRLYYRVFPAIPAGLSITEAAKRRLWGAVMALRAIYPHSEKWNNEILINLETLFNEYAAEIDLYHLAFPDDWSAKLRK